jgi:molybdopterin molybdotransferase
VSDDWDALVTRLSDALDRADVVITSGGVSMGDKDLVKPLLEQRGQVHFGRVDARPGKPVTFATVRRPMTETTTAADAQMTPVFALPGNPVSSLVSFELLVRPALLKMQGHRSLLRPMGRVKLQHDVTCAPDKVEFQRAVVSVHAAGLVASTTGRQASSRLLSMVGANALLRVPPSDVVLEAGSEVEALLLGPVVVPAPQPRSASGLPGADRAE